jgi:hypothetical protein
MVVHFVVEEIEGGRLRARSSNTPLEVEAEDALELQRVVDAALLSRYGGEVRARLIMRDDYSFNVARRPRKFAAVAGAHHHAPVTGAPSFGPERRAS